MMVEEGGEGPDVRVGGKDIGRSYDILEAVSESRQ